MSYIQHGNILIRDSPHNLPTSCPLPTPLVPAAARYAVGWGVVNPLRMYSHIGDRMLDIYLYAFVHDIYMYMYMYNIYIYTFMFTPPLSLPPCPPPTQAPSAGSHLPQAMMVWVAPNPPPLP